jgi:translation initiation factor IF-2
MRIAELATELKTTPRDLLKQAVALGVEARSILSRLDDDDVDALTKGFKRRASIELADDESRVRQTLAAKGLLAETQRREVLGSETEALQSAICRAREVDARAKAARGDAPVAPSAEAATPAPEPATGVATQAGEPAHAPSAELEAAPVTVAAAPGGEPAATSAQAPEPVVGEDSAEPAATAATDAAAHHAKGKRPPRAFHASEEDEDDLAIIAPGIPAAPVVDTFRSNRKGARTESTGDRRAATPPPRRDARASVQPPRRDAAAAAVPAPATLDSKVVNLQGAIVVKDLAAKLGMRPNVIITELMKQGVLASINQTIDATTAGRIAQSHGFTVEQEKPRRSADNKPTFRRVDADDDIPQDRPEDMVPRPPVVTFLGHVDHGKTSLMDRIRSTTVAAGEAGGITQHIGAYTVDVNGQAITFLDTPGHAAFSAMRARGASLTDIAVIIIAADDGIMPQTREAIKHARDADVAIMIAINKCDLPQAKPERVMQQLQAENLTPEEWGGDVVVCKVSAQTGEGIDHLLEMILLQSEVLELRASSNRRANGTVIEAQMEPGRGPTASVLVTGGTLTVGDAVLCGEHYGRLRAIMNAQNNLVKSAGPSMAVRLMGLSGVPEAGAEFRVMPNEKRAKQLAEEYAEKKKLDELGVTQARSVDDIFRKIHDAGKLDLRVILRADVQGSIEAIEDSIAQIKSEKVGCSVIQSGTGSITANDVQRAGSGAAIIIGFHATPESGVSSEARHYGVRIKTFRIIYELLDFIKQEMLNLLPVEHREVLRGHATIKQVFSLNRKGNVAGCQVTDGTMLLSGKARVLRKQQVLHTGTFSSIRHFQDEVKEVSAGQECGLRLENFEDYQEGDTIECFVLEEMPKAL